MENKEHLTIKPFARLLTMLGEQLIKNERIALVELIKNSYDADASWVKLSFENFGENYEILENSKIIIEDDGEGMDEETIKKGWLNPAAPDKKRKKENNSQTNKGRYIQGEKGIGRFAILKLGKIIKVTSRSIESIKESVIDYNFERYDNEFLSDNGEEKEVLLENLDITFISREPKTIIEQEILLDGKKVRRKPHGTIIEISGIKGSWNIKKIEDVFRDLNRFESIFSEYSIFLKNETEEDFILQNKNKQDSFRVLIYKDGKQEHQQENYLEKLYSLMNQNSVLKINGDFNQDKLSFDFIINDQKRELNLYDPDITALSTFRERFGNKGEKLTERHIDCGSFSFGFYIFDFSPSAPQKYYLDKEDKNIIRDHRTYLYRDGIRVYPYGEPDDDWLRIDVDRGTRSAGMFLSNDQVVGYVNITQSGNPKLQDKTNREGLIETEEATADFISLIRVFLAYIRSKPYAQYKFKNDNKNAQNIFKSDHIQNEISKIKAENKDNKSLFASIKNLENSYNKEKRYLITRAETTEELAGIGLSVETASHDIMTFMGKAMNIINGLLRELSYDEDVNKDDLMKELQTLQGSLTFIEAQLKDIQLLFKSTKQRRKSVRVKEVLLKIENIYKRILKRSNIEFKITEIGGPLVIKTTDAVLLQLFLNLFDNSVFWLQQVVQVGKKIEVTLDSNNSQLIFSDSGPGIHEEDKKYVFEPFYSGKGEEGRGLGLYIARQLLERNDFSIELADLKSEKILPGANFVINFVTGGN